MFIDVFIRGYAMCNYLVIVEIFKEKEELLSFPQFRFITTKFLDGF